MIGMIQIMIYLLCVYLVFKGVEIFQIAFMSSKTNKTAGIVIGVLMFVLSLIVAAGFFYWTETFAVSLSGGLSTQSTFDSLKTMTNESTTELPSLSLQPPIIDTEPKLEIIEVDGKFTDTTGTFWNFAWKVIVKNNTPETLTFNINIELRDNEDFIIEKDREFRLVLGGDSEDTFTGTILVNSENANKIANIYAQFF